VARSSASTVSAASAGYGGWGGWGKKQMSRKMLAVDNTDAVNYIHASQSPNRLVHSPAAISCCTLGRWGQGYDMKTII
jgi:hypothetical protein